MADKTEGKDLTPEQQKLLEGESVVGIKFVPSSGAESGTNGDAKIEVGAAAAATVGGGLRKEDLLKFANDPFWVRLRWLLFILFWLTWLAMLVGAIYIVVVAPKCPAPEPRLWWEKGELLSVNAQDEGGLKGLTEKLNEVNKFSTGFLLENVLDSDGNGVLNYEGVHENAGTLEDFKLLANKAKIMGVKIIMAININHCSDKHPWFQNSITKTGNFSNYFIWKDAQAKMGADSKPLAPNNWKNVNDGSAWTYENTRKQFYLNQLGEAKPDLNLLNPELQFKLRTILRFWRGLGVSGFLFKEASYLVEDADLKDEPVLDTPSQSVVNQYSFYNHLYTKNLDANLEILSIFKNEFTSEVDEPEDKIVFAADVDGSVSEIAKYYGTQRPPLIELPLNRIAKPNTTASLEELVSQWRTKVPADVWPNWLLSADRSKDNAALAMTLALLPGTLIYEPGAELQTLNASDVFATMQKVKTDREAPSITYGGLETLVLNKDVFGYTRRKSGNPGYMVLFNMGTTDAVVNATGFANIPESLTVVLCQPDPSDEALAIKSKVESLRIPVPAGTTIGMTFVPQKH